MRQLLTFSHEQGGDREPVAMNSIVCEVTDFLKHSLPANIRVSLNLGDGSDEAEPLIFADATQMHQIATNLCLNAAHAVGSKKGQINISLSQTDVRDTSGRDGPVVLRRGSHTPLEIVPDPSNSSRITVWVSVPKPGPYLKFTVRDTGSGMNYSTLTRIFEPFFTTKGLENGSGLGLSAVHGIVTEHDGAIAVESEPGKGTAFHLFSPRYVPFGKDGADDHSPSEEGHNASAVPETNVVNVAGHKA